MASDEIHSATIKVLRHITTENARLVLGSDVCFVHNKDAECVFDSSPRQLLRDILTECGIDWDNA